ncbi:protocadherin-9-like isoform X1 [Saccostrea cucullata]|uniref:protocadherin-9-like isoform X1 n=1 Tax=Saccostrea cuccullata TaxID=36930 RepID=UPI002ED61C5B
MASLFILLCLFAEAVAQNLVTFTIKEGIPRLHTVGSIPNAFNLAANLSKDQFDSLRYQFLANPDNLFDIGVISGDLRTNTSIDRESICDFQEDCTRDLTVTVRSKVFSYTKIFSVQIIIQDTNDNSPIFEPSSMRLSIPEHSSIGTSYKIPSATDKDVGINSVQMYEIVPKNGPFELDVTKSLDGSFFIRVVIKQIFDREVQDYYQFNIRALDGGSTPNVGVLTVHVDIEDINDNSPVFTQTTYNVSVQENITIGSNILQCVATDKDIQDNGRVSYRFSMRSDLDAIKSKFSINAQTGQIQVISALNYGEQNLYEFFIEAFDHGAEARVSQAKVIINVLDAGNNAPSMEISFFEGGNGSHSVSVREGTKEDVSIAHIKVSDSDPGQNGQVDCSSSNAAFGLQAIGSSGYLVVVKSSLDYETVKSYPVTVTCQDKGTPSMSSTLSFTVNIADDNDNAPAFVARIYQVFIQENKPPGTRVTEVLAKDKDSGVNAMIRYTLDGDYGLDIDTSTGVIVTTRPLDREATPQISVKVLAVDQGNPPLTGSTTLIVNVQDVNDNTPRFNVTQFNFQVPENLNNTKVGTVYAMDLDTGLNGQIIYTLNDESDSFYIRSDGSIFTKKPLDYEAERFYTFTVTARDQGNQVLSTNVDVRVHVDDVNDNPPKCVFPDEYNRTVSLPYLTKIGSLITTVQAYDADSGRNSHLSFRILSGNGHQTFKLDPNSGELFYDNTFIIKKDSIFRLNISISDQGDPSLSSLCVLEVTLTHTNVSMEPFSEEESNSKYVVICVIVVIITIFFSTVLITVIIIIKRNDRRNREKKCEQEKLRNLQQFQGIDKRYYQNQAHTFPEQLSKKKKKEVSFSLEDELDKSLDMSGHSIVDDQNYNVFRPGPDEDKLKQLQFGQFLINPNSDRKNNLLKGSHDSSSDTSTDLTASDSGRGGSDVEMNHHSNAPDEQKTNHLAYSRSSSFPPIMNTPPDRGGTRPPPKSDNSASNKKDYTGLTPRETFEKKHGINRHSQESIRSESCLPSYV